MDWKITYKADPRAVRIADRHYNRQKPGSLQFMPPGETLVLINQDANAIWGWWRPHPRSGLKAANGLDGWTCCIFRNEGPTLSSQLVLQAEIMLATYVPSCGPDGMLTYVWDIKVRSTNPGCCYKIAGWKVRGRSADCEKTLLHKPFENAGKT